MTTNHVIATTAGPVGTDLPCILHAHGEGPLPLYCELHHVIPQDWQHEFKPSPVPNPAVATGALWDPRTISCCRTGHGNIHYLLVRFMLRWEATLNKTPDWSQTEKNIHAICYNIVGELRRSGLRINNEEYSCAEAGMQRWHAAGLNLLDLCRNGSYGRI